MPNPENIKGHEFKPGQSGNPAGRKKGTKSLKTILKELLAAQDPGGEWSNPIAKKLLQKAFNEGDFRSLVEIVNRIEGMPKQEIDQTIRTPEPVEINFSLFERKDAKDKPTV